VVEIKVSEGGGRGQGEVQFGFPRHRVGKVMHFYSKGIRQLGDERKKGFKLRGELPSLEESMFEDKTKIEVHQEWVTSS